MTSTPETISDILRASFANLTRAERQLADSLLQNYPMSGLGSITMVAHDAEVSTPTVVRMVQKLGFSGFPEFQRALRGELQAQISDPIEKHDTWAGRAPTEHILNRFTDAVMGNIRQTLGQIETTGFDEACDLLADMDRGIYVVGGRITRALADYFFLHMQVLRPNVTHIQSISNAWPHYLLEVKEGDVVVIFDVRRYENSTLKLAELAAEKGAKIILFTDQWQSPIEKIATHTFSCRIIVPSAWDSSIVPMLLLETVVASVQERTWDTTRPRMEALEDMFDRTRFFRKFT
ncbi:MULTISPECIES: MurR/RpiR family transcriptional regulator [Falsihalocynthiibacter]|uniref:MurR/RpiR family transcriptional regulator n=1 Tax=Falsihalocynthiibacter TaxID=2854182 RepID=UPI0030018A7A